MNAQPVTLPSHDWVRTAERVAALESAAAAWLGTSYCQSGAICGSGASCHRLAGAVLAVAGFPIPAVPERGVTLKRDYQATMIEWLSTCGAFVPLAMPCDRPEVGDVLVADLGIGHIGLCLGGDGPQVLQVLRGQPVHVTTFADPRLRGRLRAVFRPIEREEATR